MMNIIIDASPRVQGDEYTFPFWKLKYEVVSNWALYLSRIYLCSWLWLCNLDLNKLFQERNPRYEKMVVPPCRFLLPSGAKNILEGLQHGDTRVYISPKVPRSLADNLVVVAAKTKAPMLYSVGVIVEKFFRYQGISDDCREDLPLYCCS